MSSTWVLTGRGKHDYSRYDVYKGVCKNQAFLISSGVQHLEASFVECCYLGQ